MKNVLFVLFLVVCQFGVGQTKLNPLEYEPEEDYDNIWVKKISEDVHQSVFVIWVKEDVKMHFHEAHTENIVVLSGKAEMVIGNEKLRIKKGDHINIPKGTHHAVTKVYRKPLKVLSIQSPLFDGKDRVFVEEELNY